MSTFELIKNMAMPYLDPVGPVFPVRCFRSEILASLFYCHKIKCENTIMNTTIPGRRYPAKPIRPTQPNTCCVPASMARESLNNFVSSIKDRFTENTTVNYLVDECSANVALVGPGFIVSLIYQEVKS